MAKRHPTLLYKLKIAFVLQLEDQKFPPEMAKNCLTQKLFNYLLFGGLAPKTTIFPKKMQKRGSKKPSFWPEIVAKKNNLIICFFPLCLLAIFDSAIENLPLFFLCLSPFFLSLCFVLSLSLFLSFFLYFVLYFFLSFFLSFSLSIQTQSCSRRANQRINKEK